MKKIIFLISILALIGLCYYLDHRPIQAQFKSNIAYKDSMGVDVDGGAMDEWLWLPCLREGTGMTFSVTGETLTLTSSGSGTSDSIGVDDDGDGDIEGYAYPAFIVEGSNMTITIANDSIYFASTGGGSGTTDSTYINDGTEYGPFTNDMFKIKEGDGINIIRDDSTSYDVFRLLATLGTEIVSGEITDQTIVNDDIDTTAEDFVFNDAYRITSAVASSIFVTKYYIDNTFTLQTDFAKVTDDTTNWNTAYGWDDHSTQNYLDDDVTGDVDSDDIADQTIVGNDVDSTAEDFVFDDAYRVTSAVAESLLATLFAVRGIVEDSLNNYTLLTDFNKVTDDTLEFHNAKDTIDAWDNGALTGTNITDQTLKGDDVDSTSEDFVFNDAYKVNSAVSDSQLITKYYVDNTFTLSTDFAKVTDDTTNYQSAYDSTSTWDNLGYPQATTSTLGIASFVSDWFSVSSGAVSILANSIDSNEIDNTSGYIWTGVHDFGDATSLEMPVAVSPTTDAEGEFAWRSTDKAIEVFDDTSRAISSYEDIDALIWAPDGVNDEIAIFHVDADKYPNGIKITNVQITLPSDGAYSMVFEEWSGDPPTADADIHTVTTGAGDAYMEVTGATITNSDLDADDYIFLHVPNTDVDWVHAKVIFWIK